MARVCACVCSHMDVDVYEQLYARWKQDSGFFLVVCAAF